MSDEEPKGNLQVVYDFQMNPASYDFLVFLAAADKYKSEHHFPGMDVHFVPGEHAKFYDRYFPKGDAEREGLFWRVCLPACRLVSSVKSVTVHGGRQAIGGKTYPDNWAPTRPDHSHGAQLFKSASRCFSASEQAKRWAQRYQNYFTLTLRQSNYGEDRNSDLKEWRAIAQHIINSGGNVVIVPDTFGDQMDGFENCILASWDLDIRLALYEGALLNMGVANGPMTLCILSDARVLMVDTELSLFNPSHNIYNGRTAISDLIPIVDRRMREAA